MDVRELAVQKKRELKGFLTVGTKYELKDAHDLSVAYTPGVAEPCLRIKDNEAESFELTCRSNMVARSFRRYSCTWSWRYRRCSSIACNGR